MPKHRLFYDKNDFRLLDVLNAVLNRELDHAQLKTLLTPYLRPHGIKELAASRGIRIAYAITHLLGSLESSQASERINALVALRDEVLTAARGGMRYNRARVLVQIIKELTRAQGDRQTQLKLAHDFRAAALGKTIYLRQQLKKYHLLEMPEECNQVTFDDRVHDANSKGRKSATHLIMDAWIKGIRHLRVVYYDHLEPAVASELFASARILGITVRVGIEYRAVFRGRFVKIVWDPDGLQDDADINLFFRRQAVQELMSLGQEAQKCRTEYVEDVTRAFNEVHRSSIRQEFGVDLPEIDYRDVVRAVGSGQPSLHHLGRHIHEMALPVFQAKVLALAEEYEQADYDSKAVIEMLVESLNAFDADTFIVRYLVPGENLDLVNPDCPCPHGEGPLLLSLSPAELTSRIKNAYHASLLTLILADLRLEDAIEMLYDCQGRITHFEMFNLKTMTDMQVLRRKPLSMLQRAINEQNTVALKRMILNCIDSLSQSDAPEAQGRLIKFSEILNNFELVKDNYRHATLKTKIGSGSTGSSSRTHGMGFAVVDTLPAKSQREVLNRAHGNCLPVSASITQTVEYIPPPRKRGFLGNMLRLASHTRLLRWVLCDKIDGWKVSEYHIDDGACGNVVTLGGVRQEADNGLRLHHERTSPKQGPSVRYLNSTLKNLLKVFLGFIPAFLTFYLTKDWWVLAYLGGVIWFSITGIRNVIQSVLGGGGFRRSQYLRWNDFVNWDRISDSLLYTGFSVPLLDYLCKSVVLDHGLGINIASNPVLLYSLMAITNGVYISSHNIFRGLPREAALGNFFRSILSIPIAIGLNFVIVMVLSAAGVANIAVELQIWAAVISKLASDCVAGFIEGLADRKYNIAMRTWDYSEKLKQVFETFSRLEVMFPTLDMVKELNDPARFIDTLRKKHDRYIPILIANALDLLYIKMYQPRATEALRQAIARMTIDEKAVFLASQCILHEERDISRLFVDGLVGREFSKALSFYLLRHRDYLEEIEKLVATSRGRAVA